MFVPAVATGERVAVWRPGDADTEPRLRLLLPGTGKSVRARALSASFVPSVQQAAHQFPAAGHRPPRSSRAGRRARSTASPRAGASAGAAVVQPGEPSAIDAALARWRGYPGGGPVELERAQRLGLISGVTEVGEALVDLGCWRTRINNLPPGPDLVSALANRPDALAPVPVRDPDAALNVAVRAGAAGVGDRVVTGWANAVLESVTARSRVLSWLQAEQYTDLALLSRNYPGLFEMLPTEVAFALRSTEATAGSAISTARTMTSRLPGTLRALHQGLIDADHAMAMARGTGTTSDDIARQVEADLLPELTAPGSTITPEQLRRRVIRRVIALDPDGAPERHRVAAADRRITRWAEDDGMAGLKVLAPAQQIAAIWEAATALADTAKHPGDTRTLGARRVDALADVCATILDSLPAPSGADAGGGPSTQAGLAPGDCTCHADRQDERSPADAGDATGIGADQATGTADRDLDDPYGCHVGSCDVDSCDPADCDPAGCDLAGCDPADCDLAGCDPAGCDLAGRDLAGCDLAGCDPAGWDAEGRRVDTPGDVPADVADAPAPAAPAAAGQLDCSTGAPPPLPPGCPGRSTDPGVSCASPLPASQPTPPSVAVSLPARQGRRPHIMVVVPYTVLLGVDDPCELVGHGTITAEQARPIIAGGVLQRLLCDPVSGTVLDYGRTRYEPPDALKQFIVARDGTCRTPGCNEPADRCQIDHIDPYRPGKPTGGATAHTNLDPKCPHHHRGKDGGGFTNIRDADGTSHWTTPLGRHYSLPPNKVWDTTDHDWDDRFPLVDAATSDRRQAPDRREDGSASPAPDEPPPF